VLQKNSHLPLVWALTLFILVFTFAIAIFDIPDRAIASHITTLTIQLGQQAVFNLARWVLTVCYLGMVLAGIFGFRLTHHFWSLPFSNTGFDVVAEPPEFPR